MKIHEEKIQQSLTSARGSNQIILLTIALRPNVTTLLAVTDPNVRLEHYKASLIKWNEFSKKNNYSLAIVETTGASLAPLLSAVESYEPSLIRTYSYNPSDHQKQRGKGAVEFAAVEAAIQNFAWPPDATVHKVTGRLWIRNAVRVMTQVPENSIRIKRRLDGLHVDTRLVSSTVKGWMKFARSSAETTSDSRGVFIEHSLAAVIVNLEILEDLNVERFAQNPEFVGISGSHSTDYDTILRRWQTRISRPIEFLINQVNKKFHY